MFALWYGTVNDEYHIHVYKKMKENVLLLKFLLSVEINSPSTNCWNCTAVKLWQFACWTGLYSSTNLTAFLALHANLIYSALLFLKTDWLPCASCLITHTLAPQYNVTFSGAIINLMANLTAWQTVHIIAVSWVLHNFYGCPKTSPHTIGCTRLNVISHCSLTLH